MPDAISLDGLSSHGLAMLVFTATVFAVFIWDRFAIATVCLGVLIALPLLFLAFPYETAAGPVDPFSCSTVSAIRPFSRSAR